ncbi:hypothetical protein [Marihabitans asiaticum]|uniref:PKD domain-containing protein n=1 Tax=Marihabitans asiaticum TaxID=415218 RepID=A0A560W7T9_9MICO|nr:hypothetical protein [Marihabitans asiaticum]TWD13671.1 hypothetical protein FB557_2301 [Marihabitans asiaticum]
MVTPPTPTFGQVQQAFRELPFAQPKVLVDPPGYKTLIRLPTYFRAEWPSKGLGPGDVSEPVQLLSWSVEFRVDSAGYWYDYGDGESSKWVASAGGEYPDGDVIHSYEDIGTYDIKVDAKLAGEFRVNGGAWQDINTVADLQDEPVAELEVLQARNRLVQE